MSIDDGRFIELEHMTNMIPSGRDRAEARELIRLARIGKLAEDQKKDPENTKDFVKVHVPGEAFWVYRVSEDVDTLIGRVDNELVCTDLHGYGFNDVIEFKKENGTWEAKRKIIPSIAPKED